MFDEKRHSQPTQTPGVQFFPAKAKASIYAKDHIYRACAYCRVSTDSDEQLSSYDLQVEHYQYCFYSGFQTLNYLSTRAQNVLGHTCRKTGEITLEHP